MDKNLSAPIITTIFTYQAIHCDQQMNDKYQDFLNKLQNASESERDWLVMEFSLQNLSEVLRQAVWAAAIPHWFDHAYLNAVLGFPLKNEDFNALTELSFVEIFPERGFNVHERSRNQLLDYLWKNNKARYKKLSKQAAAYCKKQDQTTIAWRVETLYHGLLANHATAKESFIEQGLNWLNGFQYDNLEHLTQVVLAAVNSGKLSGEVATWAAFLQAQIDILYSRYSSARNFLQLALKQKSNKLFVSYCIKSLGEIHRLLAEYDPARHCYQQALSIFRQIKSRSGEAECIRALASIHRTLSEYSLARDCYQQALAIFQQEKASWGEANCIQGLGEMHSFLGKYSQAQECFQQALIINRKIGNFLGEASCIQYLGDVSRNLAEYSQAQDYYQQALMIYQRIKDLLGEANCIQGLGEVSKNLAEYDQAQDYYQQALTIHQQIKDRLGEANCLGCLGVLYGVQQIELAATTVDQAVQLYEEIGNKNSKSFCIGNLGVLYLHQKQFESALLAFNQAIEIFPHVTAYQNRSMLYMQMEDYPAAQADINQVELMDANSAYTSLIKAEYALWQQQTLQAVELSQQALAERPADGNVRAFFALTLLADGQAQLACTEMEQALTAIYQKHDFDYLLDTLDKSTRIYGYLAEVDALRGQILERYQK
ncbi:MAG: tetratricopeptide repeat protein [Methylobacter sp.]